MRSALPKPLHPLCGRPMLLHVLDALSELYVERAVVVVGPRGRAGHQDPPGARPARPAHRLRRAAGARGTADALSVALTAFPDDDFDDADIVVLPGDTPLVRPATLGDLVAEHRESDAAATLLTARLDDPSGMGRVVRGKDGRVAADRRGRRRHRGASARSTRSATSIYCFRRSLLAPALRRISPDNAQGRVLPDRRGGGPARHRPQGGGHRRRRPHRGGRRQRPGPAGRGRGRAAPPHQRAVDAGRRHHDRPRPHLRRRRRPPGRRRHPLPRHRPPGPHRRRAGGPHRPRHPAGRLRGGRGRGGRADGRARRRDRRRRAWSGRSPSSPPGAHIPPGTVTGPFYTARGGDDDGV